MRSETLGSSGISTPPRSIIEIDGIDYSKHLDGFNIVIADITTGIVESSVNFRVDSDPSAAQPFVQYLQRIPGMCSYHYYQFICSVLGTKELTPREDNRKISKENLYEKRLELKQIRQDYNV